MARKRNIEKDLEKFLELEKAWDVNSKLRCHALNALFIQREFADKDRFREAAAYHAAVVKLLRAYAAKRTEGELLKLLDEADKFQGDWERPVLISVMLNLPYISNPKGAKFFLFCQCLIIAETYPKLEEEGGEAGPIDEISVDANGVVHGEKAELWIEKMLEKSNGTWHTQDWEDILDIEKEDGENVCDDDDDDEDEEDDEDDEDEEDEEDDDDVDNDDVDDVVDDDAADTSNE